MRFVSASFSGGTVIASLIAGARLCGASGVQENALRRYGEKIGLAFQITDDILDLEGDAEKLGKPLGSDLKQDKATYPKILGIEESRTLASQAAEDAIAVLSIFDKKADPLRALARYMVERDN